MTTEHDLNELMMNLSADLQQRSLFKPEPEHFLAGQMNAGRVSVKSNLQLSSFFACASVAIAAVLLFALTLFWAPVVPLQSAAHSPQLLDAEMAVIYRFEQAQTDPYAHARISTPFYTIRPSEIEWLHIINQLKRNLNKALVFKQLHRLVSLRKNSLHKLEYSGLV